MTALKKNIFSTSPLKIAKKTPKLAWCSIPSSHTSGEVPSASARSEPGASTLGLSKRENVVILFSHPCEPLSGSAGMSPG